MHSLFFALIALTEKQRFSGEMKPLNSHVINLLAETACGWNYSYFYEKDFQFYMLVDVKLLQMSRRWEK